VSQLQEIRYSYIFADFILLVLMYENYINISSKMNKEFLSKSYSTLPITAAARSKAWNVFSHSNTVIVGSNPTQGMDR
jgi:hypothetical protein